MRKMKKTLILVLVLSFIIITDIANAYAAETYQDETKHAISIPGEVVVTSEMFESGSDFTIKIDDNFGFTGKAIISPYATSNDNAEFKLSGRFFLVDTGQTISDYWLSASFYISSSKVYVNSYDARHTRRAGPFSGYTANVKNSSSSGEGTSACTVNADFELLLNGKPSPGTSEAYLKIIYRSDRSWTISRNYDYSSTP